MSRRVTKQQQVASRLKATINRELRNGATLFEVKIAAESLHNYILDLEEEKDNEHREEE